MNIFVKNSALQAGYGGTACNPSIQEAETRGSQVCNKPVLLSETLFQTNKKKHKTEAIALLKTLREL
jgi:hypothetical protein